LIRILVVDDQPLVRAGLGRILEPEADFELVGACGDGCEVEQAVAATDPDVVLMDIRMKDVDGAEATRRLRAVSDRPPVLVLTTFDDYDTVAQALAAGASGFVLKDAPGEDLVRATRAVASGGAWLDSGVVSQVIAAYRSVGPDAMVRLERLSELSDEQVDVFQLLAHDLTDPEIAARLGIDEATAARLVNQIIVKLACASRAEVAAFALCRSAVT
jgi:DNA-binding NarL/FixJ family response regulator